MAVYTSKGVYSKDNAGVTSPPDEGGERQDLWDVVTRIDPADAPFMNNSPKSTGTAIIHDWQSQDLNAVDVTAKAEGANVAYDGSDASDLPSDRHHNYMTIRWRQYKVSDTMDSVNHAGHAAMSIRQRTLKALELRRDVEQSLLGSVAKDGTEPRQAGGMPFWCGNGAVGATGTFPTAIDGSGTGLVEGTPYALTLDAIAQGMQDCYEDGGQPNLMYMVPAHKRTFSTLDTTGTGNETAAANRWNMTAREPATYIGAVDVYLTDFGTLECVIDRFIPPSDTGTPANGPPPILLIDNRHVGYVSMRGRNFKNKALGDIGDSDQGMVISEFTVRSNAPNAHAVLFGVIA